MEPNYDKAAIAAINLLIENNITSTPISPLPILKSMDGVIVMSFTEMSDFIGIERQQLISVFGLPNQDAVTTVRIKDSKINYIVAYNQKLPMFMVQRALARELGHIVLGHDGSRPEEVRNAEAICFANHLLCPRPLIKTIQDSGLPFTVELLGNMTGCYEHCLNCMKNTPGTNVPAELNRKVKEQFKEYAENFIRFQLVLSSDDTSRFCIFGSYMDNYRE